MARTFDPRARNRVKAAKKRNRTPLGCPIHDPHDGNTYTESWGYGGEEDACNCGSSVFTPSALANLGKGALPADCQVSFCQQPAAEVTLPGGLHVCALHGDGRKA